MLVLAKLSLLCTHKSTAASEGILLRLDGLLEVLDESIVGTGDEGSHDA